MASLERRTRTLDGRLRWRVRFRDPTGRQRSKTFLRKVDADTYRAETEAALRRGVWRDPKGEKEAARLEAVRLVLTGKPASTQLPDGPFRLLYRCWGERNRLLYVGITGNGVRRIVDQHAEKGWFEREVIAVTFERVPAGQAAEIERAAIRLERPAYNVRDNDPEHEERRSEAASPALDRPRREPPGSGGHAVPERRVYDAPGLSLGPSIVPVTTKPIRSNGSGPALQGGGGRAAAAR